MKTLALSLCVALFGVSFTFADKEPVKPNQLSVTDQDSGMTVTVIDGGTLEAKSKDGKVIWKAIIADVKKPAVNQAPIRQITLKDGVVKVVYGKANFADVDLKTGKVVQQGSD